MKLGTAGLAAIALLATAFPLAANDDLVLYVNASATFSFPMPSDASMWKELVATVDLDLNEQLAFREASVIPDPIGQGPGEKWTGPVT